MYLYCNIVAFLLFADLQRIRNIQRNIQLKIVNNKQKTDTVIIKTSFNKFLFAKRFSFIS